MNYPVIPDGCHACEVVMPNFQSEAYLRQMRDMSLRAYQQTGQKQHLRAANEAAFKMQRMAKQAMTQPIEQPRRGRPRKEMTNGN